MADLTARKVPYFPDPMVQSFALQLWTQGSGARPIAPPKVAPAYDPQFRSDIPSDWRLPANSNRCTYPFAMPLVVETVKGAALKIQDVETGYLDDGGSFSALRRDQSPPTGTVTCRRVRVTLPPSADVDLKVWCLPTSEALAWLSQVNEAIAVSQTLTTAGMHKILSTVPVPEIAEVRTVTLTHTTERPAQPVIANIEAARADLTQAAWAKLASKEGFQVKDVANVAEATTTWLGGEYMVDPAAGDITLAVSFHDVKDVAGVPFKLDEHGNPTFQWKASEQITRPLEQVDADDLTASIKVRLETAGRGPRNISLKGFDTRSYKIRITPSSTSRFVNQIVEKPGKLDRFSAQGAAQDITILATNRPAPMGNVRMLPAFVWTEKQNGVLRRAVIRLSWRRPRVSGKAQAQTADSTGCWYSSGEGEVLGVVVAPDGNGVEQFAPQKDYISAWGADPIRSNRDQAERPQKGFGAENLVFDPIALVVGAMMPPVTNQDDVGAGRAKPEAVPPVNLVTYVPRYDLAQDAWWVDVDIDPGQVATPYIRLGLVRFQPNAIDGMKVSQPSRIGFALAPKRSVDVEVLPRDRVTKLWPVCVTVRGPFGVIDGGESTSAAAQERIASTTRPMFRFTIFRDRSIFGGGEEPVLSTDSDGSPPPVGDMLWQTTVMLPHNPRGLQHHLFLEEVDKMLPANPELHPDGDLLETGPRFMARLHIE